MTLIVTSLVALALAAPFFVFHYLTRLPVAPVCPSCRRITTEHERGRGPGVDHVLAVLSATQVRRCTVCGWEGRMRWRWAIHRQESGKT